MMWTRLGSAFALCLFFLVSGCSPIPTDSQNEDSGFSDLEYFNDLWGFRISRPNDQWGISVQTFELSRDTNGLPFVDVRIASPITEFGGGGGFRPQLHMVPRALAEGTQLDNLVAAYEEQELMPNFDDYRVVGEKERIQLDGGEAIRWQFRYSQFNATNSRYPGTRFMAAVAIHNREGYFMIGNGSQDAGYPLEEYRQIVASLRFLRN